MPAVSVDSAVANAPGQRLAQPPPSAAPVTSKLPSPSVRHEWDPDDCDLLFKSANRPRFAESSGVCIRALLKDAENFLGMCGRPRDRWARFIISWLGANKAEKVRRSHFFSDDVTTRRSRMASSRFRTARVRGLVPSTALRTRSGRF